MKLPWTAAEDETIRTAAAAGLLIADILSLLPDRSEPAIRKRAMRIDLAAPPGVRKDCFSPDACKASTVISLCRDCRLAAIRADPAIEAKRRAAVNAYQSRPEVKRMLADRLATAMVAALSDPAEMERRRAHGRNQYREHLSRPEVRARNRAPEARAKATASIIETRLAGIPPGYRQHYRHLVRSKRMPAAKARAVIADLVQQDARRAIAEFDRRQRERAKRERQQAY